MHNFKELHVWKLSKDLCKEIYLVTNTFPDSEKFELTFKKVENSIQ
nr:four helix bundle protein [Flavicella marina]